MAKAKSIGSKAKSASTGTAAVHKANAMAQRTGMSAEAMMKKSGFQHTSAADNAAMIVSMQQSSGTMMSKRSRKSVK